MVRYTDNYSAALSCQHVRTQPRYLFRPLLKRTFCSPEKSSNYALSDLFCRLPSLWLRNPLAATALLLVLGESTLQGHEGVSLGLRWQALVSQFPLNDASTIPAQVYDILLELRR